METDCRNQLTWAERLALFVESKWNMGHAVWAGVYLLASLVLLPAVLILSADTGMAILAYLTVGLYGADGHTATTTLAINVFCTVDVPVAFLCTALEILTLPYEIMK